MLTATNHSLELVTSAALSTDYVASYLDVTTSGGTPGSNQGNVATATTTTIISAPAASTQRLLRTLSIRNAHASSTQTVRLQKDVGGTDYYLTPTVRLLAGETLFFADQCGFSVIDSTGRKKERPLVRPSSSLVIAYPYGASTSGSHSVTSGNAYAHYLGRASKAAVTSAQCRYRCITAGATITWAEIAIAKGPPLWLQTSTLTVVGYEDVSAVINSTGIKDTTITFSGGQTIDEGDDLWFIAGSSATTVFTLRAASSADSLDLGFRLISSVRPSTIVGVPYHFNSLSNTAAPYLVGVVLS